MSLIFTMFIDKSNHSPNTSKYISYCTSCTLSFVIPPVYYITPNTIQYHTTVSASRAHHGTLRITQQRARSMRRVHATTFCTCQTQALHIINKFAQTSQGNEPTHHQGRAGHQRTQPRNNHATQPRNHTTTHATIAHVSAHTIINICADAVYLNDSKFRSFNDDIANVLNSFDRSKVLQQREGGGGRERMLGIHKIRGKSVRKTSKTQEY